MRRMRCTFEELLLKLGLGNLYLDCLIYLFCMTASVICVVLDSRGKQGINESGFAQSRLARNLGIEISTVAIIRERQISHHDREGCSSLGDDLMSTMVYLAFGHVGVDVD